MQRSDRRVLPLGTGHHDEWNRHLSLLEQLQRIQPGELRQVVIRNDDVRWRIQTRQVVLTGVDSPPLWRKASLAKRMDQQLGVVRAVLQDHDAERTRLSWHR